MKDILKSYFYWTHPRGNVHYDVLVTLILLFVFLSPNWINFKDKPVEHSPHAAGVTINSDGKGGFIYQIEGAAVSSTEDGAVRLELLRIIEPISGEVSITKVEPIRDSRGHVLTYKVWVQKE